MFENHLKHPGPSDNVPRGASREVFFVVAAILGAMTALRLLFAAIIPPVQDEAYYFDWGRNLAWGYFDHPPLVGTMAATSQLWPSSVFFGRLGTVLCSLGVGIMCARLFFRAGLRSITAITIALILVHGNLMGLVFGFLTTPDTALLLAWTWALDECLRAISGERRRWLAAGAATGVGLLAKYTMLLIGPVFLCALLLVDRPGLKTKWPYLGGLVALLLFSPNLMWNAQNDWITLRFQLRHGFSMERPEQSGQQKQASLPKPLPADANSPEAQLGRAFDKIKTAEKSAERQPVWYDPYLKALNRYLGFYASQVALWGGLLWLFFLVVRLKKQQRFSGTPFARTRRGLTKNGHALMWVATAIPLFVFGLISLGSKVEANWSAMYIVAASALLAPHIRSGGAALLRPFGIGLGINLLVLTLLAVHVHTGVFSTRPHRDRLLKETHGYESLATYVSDLTGPKFADSYQLIAMLRFYQPSLEIHQWPGITRHSEYTRDPSITPTLESLIDSGHFWLVTTDRPPPRIRGFHATSLSQLRDCQDHHLQEIPTYRADRVNERCKKPIHEWYLVRYETF